MLPENKEQLLLSIKHSSRYAVLARLLRQCAEPTSISELFYAEPKQRNYMFLKSATHVALKLKLLERQGEKFKTSPKGKKYLKKFESLLKLLEGE